MSRTTCLIALPLQLRGSPQVGKARSQWAREVVILQNTIYLLDKWKSRDDALLKEAQRLFSEARAGKFPKGKKAMAKLKQHEM